MEATDCLIRYHTQRYSGIMTQGPPACDGLPNDSRSKPFGGILRGISARSTDGRQGVDRCAVVKILLGHTLRCLASHAN